MQSSALLNLVAEMSCRISWIVLENDLRSAPLPLERACSARGSISRLKVSIAAPFNVFYLLHMYVRLVMWEVLFI